MSYPHPPAVVVGRHDERRAGAPGSSSPIRYVATGSQTEGDFGLFEYVLRPGASGPGRHYHEGFSESFYVIEGALALLNDRERVVVRSGELAYVPRRGIHGFDNAGADDPARFLILFTPGVPREEYFDGLAALFADGRRPTVDEVDAFARRHDQVNLRD